MSNLRITNYKVIDSKTIAFQFNENLNSSINTSNISITSFSYGVPNPSVVSIEIDTNTLNITTTPLTPFAVYTIRLFSTQTNPFISVNGILLLEDGRTNAPLISGPANPDNNMLDSFESYFSQTLYSRKIEDGNSVIKTYLEGVSDVLYSAQHAINQAKSDNYISVSIIDEQHTRGAGPYDRLEKEGAYEIIRVGQYTSDVLFDGSLTISSFPSEPISLQTKFVSQEQLVVGSGDSPGTFNGLILNLNNNNVIKVTEIIVVYASGPIPSYTYSIDNFGYQIKDARYDEFASTYVLLETNQVKFSDKSIKSGFIPPVAGDTVVITYQYKNLGIYVDPTSVSVSELKQQIREVCPPIATVFSLEHANIVNSSGIVVTTGGVTFYDPQAIPPYSQIHPAFLHEVEYNENSFPSAPGYYSIDYENGKVYVYGEDTTKQNIGTGAFPPVCSYYYKYYYRSTLDYTYDPTLLDLASNSLRELIGKSVVISFTYSENYVPDVDYVPQIHKEELSERIQNRLYNLNTIEVLNKPITNVFRIFNETTGEIYRINTFNDARIIFNFNRPPTIIKLSGEKTSFTTITDETLLKSDTFTNSYALTIWKIYLNNSNIMALTEDCIGSKINTSAAFSDTSVFQNEIYFDRYSTETINIDKLSANGIYSIDYDNGIVYVAISATHDADIGSISYKNDYILTNRPHILAVDDVYTKIDNNTDPYVFSYNTFTDTSVNLTTYDVSDNRYITTDPPTPMLVVLNAVALPREAKALRGVYEINNLNSSTSPVNFAENSTVDVAIATLVPVNIINTSVVTAFGTVVVPDVFANANFLLNSVVYVKRISDGYELYNTTLNDGSFAGFTITLPTDTPAIAGDLVQLSVNITLADLSAVVVDIDFGGLFIDYTALYDEIIVSYEYGDNVLDFRQSLTIPENTTYYVSYKYGALRDSLLANFGSIINIDDFKNFNVDFNRERYRDALSACLQNFPKGPTKDAISEIARIISHIVPVITESLFEEWVLGLSYLYDQDFIIHGSSLLSSIWDYGIYFSGKTDALEIPFSNHIKIDRGTTEFWVTPNWNGLDNDATLNITIYKDGYGLSSNKIWIGADGYNPALDGYSFNLTKFDDPSPKGIPYSLYIDSSDGYGCYIYYDVDDDHWKFIVKDIPNHNYIATITTSGEFYDVQEIGTTLENTDLIKTTTKTLTLNFNIDGLDPVSDGYGLDGVSFMSDDERYLLDYGTSLNENRLSIYKDGRGYLNLKVFSKKDRYKKAHSYQISHDISGWKAGDNHHIAFSNRINSKDKRDELHFFVDGFEVPNLLKYGGRPIGALTDRFRTVVPEIVLGTVPKNTVAGIDLITTVGSNIVQSSATDFAAILGVGIIGDIIYIEETGFASSYTITPIAPGDDAHTLTLSAPMPYSLTNARFSVNKWTVPVSTELMYESNLYVSRYYNDPVDGYVEEELPGLRATIPAYSVSVDGYGQPSIVIRSGAETGDQVFIRTLGLNHRRVRQRVYVWGSDSNIINLNLPPPITLDYTKVFAVNKAKYVMNADIRSDGYDGYAFETIVGNTITTIGILPDTQPSNAYSGRILTVTASGDNTDFSIPAEITIHGTTFSGAIAETLIFSDYGSIDTSEYFTTISSIDGYVTALNILRPTMSFEIREKNQITKPDNDGYVDGYIPIIRFSWQENASSDLDGYLPNIIVSDNIAFFQSQIGDTLVLSDPPTVAGSYIITDVIDYQTINIFPDLPIAFSDGFGSIYNISVSRSGFANGLFTFEYVGITPSNFNINQGFYDFDYATYIEIPFELRAANLIIGNNFNMSANARAVIEELRSLDYQSVDTRIGEILPSTGRSITTDYLRSAPFDADSHTTLLLHMNELPPADSSVPYARFSDNYFQFDSSLNSNFNESLYINDKPFIIDNAGVLSNSAGTIEFWVNPDFDSRNDPHYRYLFDTASVVIEEATSLTKGFIRLLNPAIRVYSIQLATETSVTGTNYAAGGRLLADKQTYILGRALPYQQTPVKIIYAPSGIYGSRISIYKDPNSDCIFSILSGTHTYTVETPIFWTRDTWHRIMATWDFSKPRLGEMHLYVDGEEKVIVSSGSLLAGSGFVAGSVSLNTATNLNISIKDQFQTLYIGSNFLGGEIMSCRLDNFKFSNVQKNPVYIMGQAFDNDYNSNTSVVLPVVEDLYTTYLSDFDKDIYKIEDFSILRNKTTGAFDFTLQVIDSFDIIDGNVRVKQILENLIKTLKPANSRAFIEYIK